MYTVGQLINCDKNVDVKKRGRTGREGVENERHEKDKWRQVSALVERGQAQDRGGGGGGVRRCPSLRPGQAASQQIEFIANAESEAQPQP